MEKVCSLLYEEGFDDDVVQVFRDNKITHSVFAELNKEDIRELGIVALGDRKKLLKLIEKVRCVVTC